MRLPWVGVHDPRDSPRSEEDRAGVPDRRSPAERLGGDPAAFARAWADRVGAWDFEDVNELVRQHNDWYPVERDLPMDPRTGEYVKILGRSHHRAELGPDWVLEQFPARG